MSIAFDGLDSQVSIYILPINLMKVVDTDAVQNSVRPDPVFESFTDNEWDELRDLF